MSFVPGTRVRKIFGAKVGRTGVVEKPQHKLQTNVYVRWDDTGTFTFTSRRYLEEIKPTTGRRLKVTPGTPVKFDTDGAATFEGDFEFEIEDLGTYVQVQFPGTSYLYTYRDPSGTLKVDDLVQVPYVNSYANSVGVVARLGRGNWDGPTKDITARLQREVF